MLRTILKFRISKCLNSRKNANSSRLCFLNTNLEATNLSNWLVPVSLCALDLSCHNLAFFFWIYFDFSQIGGVFDSRIPAQSAWTSRAVLTVQNAGSSGRVSEILAVVPRDRTPPSSLQGEISHFYTSHLLFSFRERSPLGSYHNTSCGGQYQVDYWRC